MEAGREYFAGILPTPPKSQGLAEILIFADEEGYHDYADSDPLNQLNETAGMYIAGRHQIVIQGRENPSQVREVLLHEAFHEYARAAKVRLPTWLDEGIANYVSGITVEDGKVVARGRLLPGHLDELQSAIQGGWRGLSFEVLVREEQKEFYGVLRSLQYDQAWSLVHFFKHAKGLAYEPLFSRYLKALVKGEPPAVAAETAFGKVDLEWLQAEWLDYVKALKSP